MCQTAEAIAKTTPRSTKNKDLVVEAAQSMIASLKSSLPLLFGPDLADAQFDLSIYEKILATLLPAATRSPSPPAE